MIKFEKEVEQLTGRTTPMGVKEILLDRAKKEGKAEGAQIERVKIAKTLKNLGNAIADIVKITGLSVEEIKAL